MSLTQRCRQGALALTAVLGVACAADAGGDAKPAFTSGEVSGGDDATEDIGKVPTDSGEMPDNGSTCPPTTPTQCSGSCVDTNSSVDNCGACGSACTGGSTCSGGHCSGADAGADATVEAGVDSSVDGQAAVDTGADARADSSIESGVDAQPPPDSSVVDAQPPADARPEASDAQPCPACTGCCDTGGNCSKGTSASACGVSGVYCVDCTATSLTCHTGGICR